jgi:hypothetical protein
MTSREQMNKESSPRYHSLQLRIIGHKILKAKKQREIIEHAFLGTRKGMLAKNELVRVVMNNLPYEMPDEHRESQSSKVVDLIFEVASEIAKLKPEQPSTQRSKKKITALKAQELRETWMSSEQLRIEVVRLLIDVIHKESFKSQQDRTRRWERLRSVSKSFKSMTRSLGKIVDNEYDQWADYPVSVRVDGKVMMLRDQFFDSLIRAREELHEARTVVEQRMKSERPNLTRSPGRLSEESLCVLAFIVGHARRMSNETNGAALSRIKILQMLAQILYNSGLPAVTKELIHELTADPSVINRNAIIERIITIRDTLRKSIDRLPDEFV